MALFVLLPVYEGMPHDNGSGQRIVFAVIYIW
jgi:hypothetical protein